MNEFYKAERLSTLQDIAMALSALYGIEEDEIKNIYADMPTLSSICERGDWKLGTLENFTFKIKKCNRNVMDSEGLIKESSVVYDMSVVNNWLGQCATNKGGQEEENVYNYIIERLNVVTNRITGKELKGMTLASVDYINCALIEGSKRHKQTVGLSYEEEFLGLLGLKGEKILTEQEIHMLGIMVKLKAEGK